MSCPNFVDRFAASFGIAASRLRYQTILSSRE